MDIIIIVVLVVLASVSVFTACVGAYSLGWQAGYRRARTIPIGTIRKLTVDKHGMDGIIEIRSDVTVTPSESEIPALSVGNGLRK